MRAAEPNRGHRAVARLVREGKASAVSEAEADAYFATRPYGSRIGALASPVQAERPCRRSSA